MGMIRRSEVEKAAREALVMNLGDIARDGEKRIAEARAEAERIVAEARAERERLIAGAREEGLREGIERGLAEGRDRGLAEGKQAAQAEHCAALAAVSAAWEREVQAFERARVEMLAAMRRDGLRLVISLAERIARRAIAADESAALAQLEAALSLIAGETRINVMVNPADEPLVREALPALVASFGEVAHATLSPDDSVERGGCIVRTGAGGTIDATIRTQVERLAASIGVEIIPADAPENSPVRAEKHGASSVRDAVADKRHAA